LEGVNLFTHPLMKATEGDRLTSFKFIIKYYKSAPNAESFSEDLLAHILLRDAWRILKLLVKEKLPGYDIMNEKYLSRSAQYYLRDVNGQNEATDFYKMIKASD